MVNAYLSTVMGKGNFCNVGDLTIGVQTTRSQIHFSINKPYQHYNRLNIPQIFLNGLEAFILGLSLND